MDLNSITSILSVEIVAASAGSSEYKLTCSYNVKAPNISLLSKAESFTNATVLFKAVCMVASVSYEAGSNHAWYARQPAFS